MIFFTHYEEKQKVCKVLGVSHLSVASISLVEPRPSSQPVSHPFSSCTVLPAALPQARRTASPSLPLTRSLAHSTSEGSVERDLINLSAKY